MLVLTRCCEIVKIAAGQTLLCNYVDWLTFPVLHSTYSWRVTTYVGKPFAIGQPTRPTQPFILSR